MIHVKSGRVHPINGFIHMNRIALISWIVHIKFGSHKLNSPRKNRAHLSYWWIYTYESDYSHKLNNPCKIWAHSSYWWICTKFEQLCHWVDISIDRSYLFVKVDTMFIPYNFRHTLKSQCSKIISHWHLINGKIDERGKNYLSWDRST